VRYAGAAYLVVLGVKTLRDRSEPPAATAAPPPTTAWTVWRQGFLVGIGNPKVSYGLFGGLVRRRLAGRPTALRRGRVAVGLTYLGLGGLAAVFGGRAA